MALDDKQIKIVLDERDLPTHWYNIVPDLPFDLRDDSILLGSCRLVLALDLGLQPVDVGAGLGAPGLSCVDFLVARVTNLEDRQVGLGLDQTADGLAERALGLGRHVNLIAVAVHDLHSVKAALDRPVDTGLDRPFDAVHALALGRHGKNAATVLQEHADDQGGTCYPDPENATQHTAPLLTV